MYRPLLSHYTYAITAPSTTTQTTSHIVPIPINTTENPTGAFQANTAPVIDSNTLPANAIDLPDDLLIHVEPGDTLTSIQNTQTVQGKDELVLYMTLLGPKHALFAKDPELIEHLAPRIPRSN